MLLKNVTQFKASDLELNVRNIVSSGGTRSRRESDKGDKKRKGKAVAHTAARSSLLEGDRNLNYGNELGEGPKGANDITSAHATAGTVSIGVRVRRRLVNEAHSGSGRDTYLAISGSLGVDHASSLCI